MKNLIFILLMVLSVTGLSQNVSPDLPVYLSNVHSAVQYHSPATTFDLNSCFGNSKLSYFDPNYNNDNYAEVSSILRFRNYGPHNVGGSIPYVVTNTNYFSSDNFTINGSIANTGGSPITEIGFCWSYTDEDNNPTIDNTLLAGTYHPTLQGKFYGGTYGFIPNNKITVRAYAKNIYGVGYGASVTFMPTNLQPGDLWEGGVLAYIEYDTDYNIPHGFVVLDKDLPGTFAWGCSMETGARGINYRAGQYNTQKIVDNCSSIGMAGRVCYELVTTTGGYWYDDWWLPGSWELVTIHTNLISKGLGNFPGGKVYWSSEEDLKAFWNYSDAFYLRLDGTIGDTDKESNTLSVRPIRYF